MERHILDNLLSGKTYFEVFSKEPEEETFDEAEDQDAPDDDKEEVPPPTQPKEPEAQPPSKDNVPDDFSKLNAALKVVAKAREKIGKSSEDQLKSLSLVLGDIAQTAIADLILVIQNTNLGNKDDMVALKKARTAISSTVDAINSFTVEDASKFVGISIKEMDLQLEQLEDEQASEAKELPKAFNSFRRTGDKIAGYFYSGDGNSDDLSANIMASLKGDPTQEVAQEPEPPTEDEAEADSLKAKKDAMKDGTPKKEEDTSSREVSKAAPQVFNTDVSDIEFGESKNFNLLKLLGEGRAIIK